MAQQAKYSLGKLFWKISGFLFVIAFVLAGSSSNSNFSLILGMFAGSMLISGTVLVNGSN